MDCRLCDCCLHLSMDAEQDRTRPYGRAASGRMRDDHSSRRHASASCDRRDAARSFPRRSPLVHDSAGRSRTHRPNRRIGAQLRSAQLLCGSAEHGHGSTQSLTADRSSNSPLPGIRRRNAAAAEVNLQIDLSSRWFHKRQVFRILDYSGRRAGAGSSFAQCERIVFVSVLRIRSPSTVADLHEDFVRLLSPGR